MSDQKIYSVSVAIFRSEPQDYKKKRHVGLYFQPRDAYGSEYFIDVVGSTKAFAFHVRENYRPEGSARWATTVPVADLKKLLTPTLLIDLMRAVPINNDDPEFSCQNWVGFALKDLSAHGYISQEDYRNGFDKMVDATMEAEDDDWKAFVQR